MKKKILVFSLWLLVFSSICFADDVWYVDPNAVGTGDGTSYTNAYTSLNAALQAKEEDLQAATKKVTFKCRAIGGTADTTSASVDTTWNGNATYYVTIECEDNESTGRHSGIYSTSCYRMEVAGNCLTVNSDYTVVDGLQFNEKSSGSAKCVVFPLTNSVEYPVIKNCLFKDTTAGTDDRAILFSNYTDNPIIYNNIFYDFPIAISDGVSSGVTGGLLYNCTFHNMSTRALSSTENIDGWVVRNCIFDNCTADSDGEFVDPNASDYNSTTNASIDWGAAAHDSVSQTHPFNNPDGGDFSLTAAIAGETDPSSGLFSNDVNNQTRGDYNNVWDRGAWEFITGTAPIVITRPRIININHN